MVRSFRRYEGPPGQKKATLNHGCFLEPEAAFPGEDGMNSYTRLGRAAGYAFSCALALSAMFSCGFGTAKMADRFPDPSCVVAHSDGIVSCFDKLSVILGSTRDSAKLEGVNPFSFEPAISGKVSWSADGSRADFIPENPLEAGKTYKAVFDFAKMGEPSNGWFTFKFRVAEPGLSVHPGSMYAAIDGSLSLNGMMRSDDAPSTAAVEKVLSAKINGAALEVTWSHETGGIHHFAIKNIPRKAVASSLELSWNGKPIGSGTRGSKRYAVPADGSFELLSIEGPVQGGPSCLTVAFSSPLDRNQDFRGLIRVEDAVKTDGHGGAGDLRFEAEGGMVRVYTSRRWPDLVDITVEKGIRSSSSGVLAKPVSETVRFDWEIPQVRFQSGAAIVPTSQGTRVVLETRNLSKVVVEALVVHADAMLQFLQVNELDGSSELKRVGDVVWRDEIDLGWTPDKKNQWTPYALDLAPLVSKYPEGLIQLRVAFGHEHIQYISPNDYQNLGRWEFPPVTIKDDDEESSYWGFYEDWFDWDEYYLYRDDPAHPAFYVQAYGEDRTVRRNVLVSDVAISARLDADDSWHIVATDLRTVKPLPGASVKLYGFSMREIAAATTDRNGMALIPRPAAGYATQPFFVLVEAAGIKTGRERGFLKLSAEQTLAVSHFDTGGDVSESGIKGFIYGERGVWRPGDDIHLCFVLYDSKGSLPPGHPVHFQLENPLGQIVRQAAYTASVDGFYYIKTGTETSAPTGTWTATVNVGGKVFTKAVKVESVMPNRLKLVLDYGARGYASSDMAEMGIKAAWLSGASAPGLKADVTVSLRSSTKAPGDYAGFSFLDPTRTAPSQRRLLFEGNLDASGAARFDVDFSGESEAPGPLTASFLTRAFERSGVFSTESFSVDFHPYERYVGVKLPAGDKARGMLLTDTDHPVEIIMVDREGKPSGEGKVEVAVYKLEWRWWWEKGEESLAEQASDIYSHLVASDTVSLKKGRGTWKLRINYPDWGRYLIRVSDTAGGHAAGSIFYIDWPGWAGRGTGEGGGSAVMLTLSTDKEKYAPGDTVKVSLPSNKEGRAFLTIERAGRVLKEEWVEARDGTTVYEFKATADMAPNVYAHASFIQPHLQTMNDLPIRLYGVLPIMVENPATRLVPVIGAPAVLEPMKKATVTVSEKSGKPMTYTLAVVDEGLLGITRYATPDPWDDFYRKEASRLISYDIYNNVAGAYSGKLQTLLAIGGSESDDGGGTRKISRYPPVVQYFGPFTLAKGAKANHELELGAYVGAVRFMVVAGTRDGAFGKTELETPVRSALMAFMTAPRVLGPGEKLSVPVTLLGFMGKGATAKVSLKVEGEASISGESIKTVTFAEEGEQATSFDVVVADRSGNVKLTVEAAGAGGRISSQSISLLVRSAAVPVTTVTSEILAAKAGAVLEAALPGMDGTNEAWLELSLVPPIDLSGRLSYLIGYPHGCGEQVTSKAFPQLFLSDAMILTAAQAEAARANVAAAISKLAGYQSTRGGFVFWPGSYEESPWLSAYVTHFLTMARRQGFTVPDSVYDPALVFLRKQAAAWNAQADHSKAEQAYRLYVLALAGSPDIASMNRYLEYSPHPVAALYQTAAAYALAGMKDRASRILADAPVTVEKYNGMSFVYGSVLRDRAIVLDALNTMGDTTRALPIFKKMADDLSSKASYSTQDISFALLASLPYMKSVSSGTASVDYSWGGGAGTATISKAMARIPLVPGTGRISVKLTNTSAKPVYSRLILVGTPKPGTERSLAQGLTLAARYLDTSEKAVDPAKAVFGSDLIVEVSVRNTSGDDMNDVALTFRAPSGWEIANLRLGRSTDEESDAPSVYDYQDIRDDRVATYFSMKRGELKRFRFYVNKAYEGEFFMPAITAEAMYSPGVFAVLPGKLLPRPSATGNPNVRSSRP